LGNSATFVEWLAQMHTIKGWSRPTFKRRLKGFKQRHPELTGARWQGDPYSLPTPPTAAMADLVASLRVWLSPSRPVSPIEPTRIRAQVGSAGFGDSGEDLLARAKTYVNPTRME
jgi:hypothetical protein